ncbi:hypothetical protein W02_37820 [Nitrospira sp. KM1]|nr:hypothetical protein W02_37820 [Nitrospira sp. KM1]
MDWNLTGVMSELYDVGWMIKEAIDAYRVKEGCTTVGLAVITKHILRGYPG